MSAESTPSTPRVTGFRVYVIELGRLPAAGGHRPVYVGSTGKTIEDRFRDHINGTRTASRHPHRHGTALLPALFQEEPTYATRDAAETAERRLRTKLEGQGYSVFGASGRKMPRSRRAWAAR